MGSVPKFVKTKSSTSESHVAVAFGPSAKINEYATVAVISALLCDRPISTNNK